MNKNFTISDISRLAGVSKATVSRVLNNSPKVSTATRERVLKIILEHQYEPSNVARSLSRNKTSTIGVILEDIANPFFMEVAKGIEDVLQHIGYTMFLTSSDWIAEKEIELTKLLIGHRVDGILLTPINPDSESVKLMRKRNLPFIMMNCYSGNDGSVTTDNHMGGLIATRHLIGTGHTRLLCLEGFKHQTASERVRGFLEGVEEANKERREKGAGASDLIEAVVLRDVNRNSDGFEISKRIAEEFLTPDRPTAVFALNDFVAMGVIEGFIQQGMGVPEDVSVMGYDDIMFAGQFTIPLTTIYQAKYQMGKIAAGELLDQIGNKERISLSTVLQPKLVVRKTTCLRK